MTVLARSLAILFAIISAASFSACKHHYKGYYWDHWKPSFRGRPANSTQSSGGVSQSSYQPDPFYAQQAAKREANMRAVQEQQRKNDMYNYQHGYTNKLPN